MLPQTESLYGWIAIAVLYGAMGIMAAGGTIFAARNIFRIHYERGFYGYIFMLLVAPYAAFVAHFGDSQAWETELIAIAAFVGLGFIGVFLTHVLALAYLLYGAWNLIHQLHQTLGLRVIETAELTTIPMLYGVFGLTYSLMMVGYIYYRRSAWTH